MRTQSAKGSAGCWARPGRDEVDLSTSFATVLYGALSDGHHHTVGLDSGACEH
jgi:hypothetical protein